MCDLPPPPSEPPLRPYKKPVLNEMLIPTMNSWGNVQYGIPLRHSYNETRTSYSRAHRYIPPIPYGKDYTIRDSLPERVCGRDQVVEGEGFRTTSSAYCVKPNPNKATERADCAMNCKRVAFITSLDKRLQKMNIVQPTNISEMKDNFRGLPRPPTAPPDIVTNPPDPFYIFDAVAATRNEAPVIPVAASGFRRLMDPYLTTHNCYYKPYTPDEQYATKDQITLYTEFDVPKVRGFGPRLKEIWQPLQGTYKRAVYDKITLGKEAKEVTGRQLTPNIKGIFESEMQSKYKVPFCASPLVTAGYDLDFDLPNVAPNPYQATIAPFMYCSDYCLIAKGMMSCNVVDQTKHVKPHTPCKERYVVSRGG